MTDNKPFIKSIKKGRVPIPRQIQDELGISEDDAFLVNIDGKQIVLKRIPRKKLQEATYDE